MNTSGLLTLDQIATAVACVVDDIVYPAHGPGAAQRLEDIGFLPGEPVMVLHRGALGGDPLAVRIGPSTFALRRAEAACVRVRPATAVEAKT